MLSMIFNELKTPDGKEALNSNNLICEAIKISKKVNPDLGVITDVALDPYTGHGHDGIIHNDQIDNDGNGLIDADDENESNDIPSGDIAMLLTNWEIRFPMPWRLGGVIFADGGNISNDFRSLNTNELVWNYGFALTLNLPVGPIRIDYAQDSKDASINQIQLGFLYAF